MDKVLEKHNKPTKDIEILNSILSSKEIELITKHLPFKRIQAQMVSLVDSVCAEERICESLHALREQKTTGRAARGQTRTCGVVLETRSPVREHGPSFLLSASSSVSLFYSVQCTGLLPPYVYFWVFFCFWCIYKQACFLNFFLHLHY